MDAAVGESLGGLEPLMIGATGTSKRKVVPAPACEVTLIVPLSEWMRWRMRISPRELNRWGAALSNP